MKQRISLYVSGALLSALIFLPMLGCSQQGSEMTGSTPPSQEVAQSAPEDADSATMPTDPAATETSGTEQAGVGGGSATTPASPPPRPTPASAGSQVSTPTAASSPTAEPAASPNMTPPPPPPPRTFTLTSGSRVSVLTTSTLSTKTNKTGESFVATLAEPITDGDWVIAGKGATVEGTIVDSDPGGRVKGVASITVRLKSLTLADGRKVAISSSQFTQQAETTKKKDAAKVGIGAGVGAAVGAIAGGGKGAAVGAGVGAGAGTAATLATRGDPATIASETRLTFQITSPVEITKQ